MTWPLQQKEKDKHLEEQEWWELEWEQESGEQESSPQGEWFPYFHKFDRSSWRWKRHIECSRHKQD